MNEIVCECERCGKPIPKGNAYVCIYRSIEHIEHSVSQNEDIAQIIDADILIALCSSCGNKFDAETLVKIISSMPFERSRIRAN
jgi:hypothetical protein